MPILQKDKVNAFSKTLAVTAGVIVPVFGIMATGSYATLAVSRGLILNAPHCV